jgi:hypothetical protein
VSLNSFLGQYLLILDFPSDVQEPLSDGRVNLQEAAQFARLTAERLESTPAKAKSIRAELLRTHLTARGSQNSLRSRVREILGEVVTVSSREMAGVMQKVDELLEIDPSDKRHLFYEEMKRFFYAMREIEPEDVDDDSLDEFMTATDQLSNAIYRIELKRRQREKGHADCRFNAAATPIQRLPAAPRRRRGMRLMDRVGRFLRKIPIIIIDQTIFSQYSTQK